MANLVDRIRNAWNVFRDKPDVQNVGASYSIRPDRNRFYAGTERSILSSIYTRIGIDVAAIPIRHVRLDQNERFVETIQSGLNNCLTLEANIDQSGRAFIQDAVMSMCDEGCVALVPVDTTLNPNVSGAYDILTLRTAKVVEWFPEHVRINLYNQRTGLREDVILSKGLVSIIENPLYAVMNEPNSTLKRLINKLALLDAVDQQSGSGKLDLIIQLPYVIKTEARKQQAETRRKDIETQLQDSKYGVVYTDGSERITQLNRPAENNLLKQVEYLTSMLYNQLGMSPAIFDGTADEAAMLNYYNRTIEPILAALCDGMRRTFLTKTGRSQGQSIIYMRDPFRLVPVTELADIGDKFTRNEIMSSNEMRSVVGLKPSKEAGADDLRNKNLNPPTGTTEELSNKDTSRVKMEGVE